MRQARHARRDEHRCSSRHTHTHRSQSARRERSCAPRPSANAAKSRAPSPRRGRIAMRHEHSASRRGRSRRHPDQRHVGTQSSCSRVSMCARVARLGRLLTFQSDISGWRWTPERQRHDIRPMRCGGCPSFMHVRTSIGLSAASRARRSAPLGDSRRLTRLSVPSAPASRRVSKFQRATISQDLDNLHLHHSLEGSSVVRCLRFRSLPRFTLDVLHAFDLKNCIRAIPQNDEVVWALRMKYASNIDQTNRAGNF